MRHLKQQCPTPAQQQRSLAVHPPGQAARAEQARVTHPTWIVRVVASPWAWVPSGRVTWAFIWLMVGLKIPIIALGVIVWRAIHAEPAPPEDAMVDDDGGGGTGHPKPRRPRPPRRGPHAEPLPEPPARGAAVGSSDSHVR